jgi:hypothetical protein
MQTACLHGGFYGTPEAAGLQAEFARIPQADGSLVVVPDVDPDASGESLLNSLSPCPTSPEDYRDGSRVFMN